METSLDILESTELETAPPPIVSPQPARSSRRSSNNNSVLASMSISQLDALNLDELRELARSVEITGYTRLKKTDLIMRLLRANAEQQGYIFGGGILEIVADGIGFLRSERLLPGAEDVYVSQSQIRRFGLRTGDFVVGQVRPPKETEKYHGLLKVEAVNGLDPEVAKKRPLFEKQTPIFPNEQMLLETKPNVISTRMIDLLAPIGRGQRGLIVSPPKAGKTTILKRIANGITTNYKDIHLMVVLIGERPEEVTDMDRSVEAEVVSSTFDEPVQNHVQVAEMALDRAKRLVESQKHVVILLDSITRLARAYNLTVPPSGRTLSGGMDPAGLYPPKHFFGAARNLEEGGSLTIIATCLVDTGSRMDDVIYEEFKGTGNMELHLNRKLAERRVFPAFDIERSGTRAEEKLLDAESLAKIYTLRRMIDAMGGGQEAILPIIERMSRTRDNREFLDTLTKRQS
ncbi:MAG: transcription termination factor Rho [Caldilineaceae bacterium]